MFMSSFTSKMTTKRRHKDNYRWIQKGQNLFFRKKGWDDVRIHNEPDEKDLITAQVLIVFVVVVIIAFGVGLAIGGFYF